MDPQDVRDMKEEIKGLHNLAVLYDVVYLWLCVFLVLRGIWSVVLGGTIPQNVTEQDIRERLSRFLKIPSGVSKVVPENDNTQANPASAYVEGNIQLNAGSDDSIIIGLEINGEVHIYAGNIVLKRNKVYMSQQFPLANNSHILVVLTPL